MGEHPAHVVISADSRTAFVTNGGEVYVANTHSGSVTVIEVATIPAAYGSNGISYRAGR